MRWDEEELPYDLNRIEHYNKLSALKLTFPKKMKVIVNDNLEELPDNLSIMAFLVLKDLEKRRGIVVLCNGEVVKRDEWEKVILKEGDEIKIYSFVQGG